MNTARGDDQPLDGRIALVTGASRGLGVPIARELAASGADVVVIARDAVALEAIAIDVRGTGRRALVAALDITDDAAVEAMAAQVAAEFGRVDILVNNAGVVVNQPLLETSPKRLDLLWRVNVRAPTLLMQAFVPAMAEAGWGHVVNIASLSSQVRDGNVPLGYAGYTSTKAALVRMSLAAAIEVRDRGVAVNAVAPTGLVETEGWQKISGGRRLPNAEPIDYLGRAVAWIVSQDPRRLSGRFLDSQQVLAMAGALEQPALTYADLAQVDVLKDWSGV